MCSPATALSCCPATSAILRGVAAAIPASRQLVLANVGHTAMMEDPRTTARAILGLIEDAAHPAV